MEKKNINLSIDPKSHKQLISLVKRNTGQTVTSLINIAIAEWLTFQKIFKK